MCAFAPAVVHLSVPPVRVRTKTCLEEVSRGGLTGEKGMHHTLFFAFILYQALFAALSMMRGFNGRLTALLKR